MATLHVDNLPHQEKKLHVPPLEEIKEVLQNNLQAHFKHVQVDVIDCPNLTNEPYNLACTGLGGSPTLLEVGGEANMFPTPNKTKIYDLKNILLKYRKNKNADICAIGASTGLFLLTKANCEGIFDLLIRPDGTICNCSYTAKVDGPEEKLLLESLPNEETRFPILGNFFVSEGKACRILQVNCKQRIGQDDFVTSIRQALADHYKDQCIGLGGLFLVKSGTTKIHVMRDFSRTPIKTKEQVNEWLKYFDIPPVVNYYGVLVSIPQPDIQLRLDHFHGISNSQMGGHYHYDTTPDIVEYDGYFNVIETVLRIDKTPESNLFDTATK